MALRTARENRRFYNNAYWYEEFQEAEGWQTHEIIVSKLLSCPGVLLNGGEKILDAGCGPGFVGKELWRAGWRGFLVGVDIAEERLVEAKKKAVYKKCVQANVYKLPFGDKSFNIVISNAMVGLTGIRSVKEMRRLVKPGGYLVINAGEINDWKWCRERFKQVCKFLNKLPDSKLLLRQDLGNGYNARGVAYATCFSEHYVLFLHQC